MTGAGADGPPARRLLVGYLVSQYPTVTHTYLMREIRTLRALGLDVRVVSIRKPDRCPEKLSPEEAEEARLTSSVLGCGFARMLGAHARTLIRWPLAYALALWYAIRLAGSDISKVAAHGWYFIEAVVAGDFLVRAGVRHFHTHYASTPALIAARLYNLDFSLTVHGSGEFDDVVAFHMSEKVNRAAFVVAISRFASSQIMRASASRHWSKIHVLPLGVDPGDLTPPPQTTPDGAAHLRILSVGSLVPAKGYRVLLAAVASLLARKRRVELTIVGEGPERRSLEEAIAEFNLADAVSMVGQRSHEEVIEFYRRADAFALSSFAEGVPVVLMEAMAMKIPCVATWVAGVPELIRDGVDGLLAPPGDPEPLAAGLEKLIEDPGLRARLGESARLRVLEHYHLQRNTALLAEMLRQYARAR